MSFFHVVTRPDWTIRDGQNYAETSADNVPVLQIVLSETESLAKTEGKSLFVSDSLDIAKDFAISEMTTSRRVLADCVLSIRQTRVHNLVNGTIPGITKQGFMTKTEDAKRATREHRESLAKERENGDKDAKTETKKSPAKKSPARVSRAKKSA